MARSYTLAAKAPHRAAVPPPPAPAALCRSPPLPSTAPLGPCRAWPGPSGGAAAQVPLPAREVATFPIDAAPRTGFQPCLPRAPDAHALAREIPLARAAPDRDRRTAHRLGGG